MSTPRVSLITPTFGRHKFLPLAAKFVSHQSVSDIEWLVLDDSPEPSEFMQRLADPRIVYEHTAIRCTTGDKRNRLIDRAKGNIIALFDDDDFYGPNYLARMLSALEENDADIAKLAGGNILRVMEAAEKVAASMRGEPAATETIAQLDGTK